MSTGHHRRWASMCVWEERDACLRVQRVGRQRGGGSSAHVDESGMCRRARGIEKMCLLDEEICLLVDELRASFGYMDRVCGGICAIGTKS